MAGAAQWPLLLAYHHLHESKSSRYVMTVRAFEQQLLRLLDAGYKPISLDDAVAGGRFGRDDITAPTFSLTFDDGLLSFKTHALPVLERLDLVGASSVFVPTRFVGESNAWRHEPTALERLRRRTDLAELLMSWDDLRDLRDAGVCVASHGDGHLAMNRLTYDEARADAELSRSRLTENGLDSRYIALPFGWLSAECKAAVRDAGFHAAFGVTHGDSDCFDIRRVPVYGTDWFAVDRLKTSGRFFGAYDVARRLAGKAGSS